MIRIIKRATYDEETGRRKDPTIGRCHCGHEVILEGFTCTCHGCGRDYNSAGQELASRQQWGEETGETASDVLMSEAAGFPELD